MKRPLSPFGSVLSQPIFAPYVAEPHLPSEPEFLAHFCDHAPNVDLRREEVFVAWELVTLQRELNLREQCALLALILGLFTWTRRGNTAMPWGNVQQATAVLAELLPPALPWAEKALAETLFSILDSQRASVLIGVPGDYKPLIYDGRAFYLERLLRHEDNFIDTLGGRLAREQRSALGFEVAEGSPMPPAVSKAFKAVCEHAAAVGMPLTLDQQMAVLTCMFRPMVLITGGPGTGKTTVLASILRLLLAMGWPPSSIALSAPTGKAAQRMGQALASLLTNDGDNTQDFQPQTLHRLLGYRPQEREFMHHRHNPLQQRVIIVDEASMIDLALMEHVVQAVRSDAHLILVGDAEQLPSVQSGAVFRDLVTGQGHTDVPWRDALSSQVELRTEPTVLGQLTVRLQRNHRIRSTHPEGAQILEVARAINAGSTSFLESNASHGVRVPVCAQPDELRFSGVEFFDTGAQVPPSQMLTILRTFVRKWFDTHWASIANYHQLIDQALPYVNGAFLNEDLQLIDGFYRALQSAKMLCLTKASPAGTRSLNALCADALSALTAQPAEPFALGTPVMVTKNDYDRDLYNGDQGVVLPIRLLWTANSAPSSHDLAKADKTMHPIEHAAQSRESVHPMVVFPRSHVEGRSQYRAFSLRSLQPTIEPAFAMTVHKSQGSEFNTIALVLPHEPIALLTREVIYTALTRCSNSATVVGSRNIFESGVERKTQRFSQLRIKLEERLRADQLGRASKTSSP